MPKHSDIGAHERDANSHLKAAAGNGNGKSESGHASAPALDSVVKAYEESNQVHEKSKNEGKLSDAEIQTALRKLSRWTVSKSKLHCEYKFADFIHAFGFMATAAIAIQAMGHHPEWSNVYNVVTVDLTTHDAGGITNKDLELAGTLDGFAAKLM